VLNVNDAAAAEALIDATVKEFGALHVLVNNAGITQDQLAMRMKDEDWDAVIDTNLKSVFRLARCCADDEGARAHHQHHVGGRLGRQPGQANYAAAKAGVAGMTRALAREIGSRGITVNCVAPGFIDTDMTKTLPEEQQAALKTQIPLGRLGSRKTSPPSRFCVAAGRLHHRHDAARQRRHVHVTESFTIRAVSRFSGGSALDRPSSQRAFWRQQT
jgi:3-oxoacyl-[acyl-carrier protein] reductase